MFSAAVHESAHAVAAILLGFRVREVRIWSGPDGIVRGHALMDFGAAPTESGSEPPPDGTAHSMIAYLNDDAHVEQRDAVAEGFRQLLPGSRAMDYLVMSVAGRVAQARVAPEIEARAGAEDDIAAEQLVINLALSDRERQLGARQTACRLADHLLNQNWETVLRVANELRVTGRLDGGEVEAIIENARKGCAA